jgi:hypothetical protein
MTSLLRPDELPELDFSILDRELDRTKTRVFLGKSASFLGPLMCSLHFQWDKNIPTAATNGIYIKWNPYYFHFLAPKGRDSIMIHELKHVALLHPLRRGDRDPRVWNMAVDTVLDNEMDLEGYCVDGAVLFPPELFPPSKTFVDHATYGTMAAEEIYDLMFKKQPPPPPSGGSGSGQPSPLPGQPGYGTACDLVDPEPGDQHAILNNVISAVHSAKIAGDPGSIPGETEVTLKKFLAPKIAWEVELYNFFTELGGEDYSWSRPNRRYLGL